MSETGIIVTVKTLMETSIYQTICQNMELPGSIEPIDRNPLERQLENICNQKAGSLVKPEIAEYILYDVKVRGDPEKPGGQYSNV